jgi:PadR family transcriptional regulator, regulatory protein PadR
MYRSEASGVGPDAQLLKGNTPALVLAVLESGPRHGYAIAREIERRSDNALAFKEGTLYPALHALEREGLVAGDWESTTGGRGRKVYRITPAGLAELERRRRTWRAFAAAVERVIGGSDDEEQPVPVPRLA